MAKPKRDPYQISDKEKAFAILYMSGEFTRPKAYQLVFPEKNERNAYTYANRTWNIPAVQEYVENCKKMREKEESGGEESGDDYSIDKRKLIRKMSRAFNQATDPKLIGDIGVKLADLIEAKKDNSDQEKRTKFYLPMVCHKCPLYLKENNTETLQKP